MGEKYCGIYMYGARENFLLFGDQQDTKPESWGMEIGVDGPIYIYKYQSPNGTMISIPHKRGGV